MARKIGTAARLAAIRRRIDTLDGRLLRSINDRARLALAIGRLKQRRKWPVYDPAREVSVLRHVMQANHGPLSDRAVQHIFQAILSECRRRERSSSRKRNAGGS